MPYTFKTDFAILPDALVQEIGLLSGTEAKVLLLIASRCLRPGSAPAPLSYSQLAALCGICRKAAITATARLNDLGLIQTDGYVNQKGNVWSLCVQDTQQTLSDEDADFALEQQLLAEQGGVKITPPQPQVVQKLHHLLLDDSNREKDSSIDTSSTGESISPLTLRQRVMSSLNGSTDTGSTLGPYSCGYQSKSQHPVAPAKNKYQHHVRVLYDLWYTLFGVASRPEPPVMARLIKQYGGYQGGGSHKLALKMLSLANVEGDPTSMLFAGGYRATAAAEHLERDYPDYTDYQRLPDRENDLD